MWGGVGEWGGGPLPSKLQIGGGERDNNRQKKKKKKKKGRSEVEEGRKSKGNSMDTKR